MKIITVANNKGGVGKTPTTYYTALRLAQKGKRVCVIDLDGQGNLTDMLKPGGRHDGTIVDVLEGSLSFDDALQSVTLASGETLAVAAATGDLYDLETSLSNGLGVMKLYNALRYSECMADVVLIDTPPNVGAMTLGAIIAAGMMNGWVVVPTRPDADSVSGIKSIRTKIEEAKQIPGCNPVLLGTIATQVRETRIHGSWLTSLTSDAYPPVLGITPLRGGDTADYELRKLYAGIADIIWQRTGGDVSE